MLFLQKKGMNKKRILVIGGGKTGMEFSNIIDGNMHLGYEIVGFLDDEQKPYLNGKYFGTIDKIDEMMENHSVEFDEVVVALPSFSH